MKTSLSKNFNLEEFIYSETAERYGIDNTPSEEIKNNINELVVNVMQPIRDKYGKPIIINSGYRCPELNKKVGGSKTSRHLSGYACDFETKSGQNAELFNMIKEMIDNGEIEVDQLIWEYGTRKNPNWIHIGLHENKMRNQILYFYS